MPSAESNETPILQIPLEQIRPDPSNPRSHPEEELGSLEENLKATGKLLQPIRVRREGNGFVVITGERRLLAAKKAGWKTISAIVDTTTPTDQILLDQLVENCLRRDMSLLDTARALQNVLDETGIERKDLARRLGQSPAWVSRMTKLLVMTGSARDALENGLLACPQAAVFFSKLSRRDQARLLRAAKRTGTPISRRRLEPLLAPSPPRTTDGDEGLILIAFKPHQARRVIGALGGTAPEDDDALGPHLRSILRSLGAFR